MKLSKYMKVVPVDEGYYFLINGLNGAIEVADETIYQIYKKWEREKDIKPGPAEGEICEHLRLRGFIVEEGEDEKLWSNLLERLKNNLARKSNHLNLTFLITYDCNLRCTYCFERPPLEKEPEHLNKKMSPEMVRQIFDSLDKNNYIINQSLIYGGEPFLLENEDTVLEILKQNAKRSIKTSVITNGYNLTKYIDKIKKYEFKQFQITLDGPKEIHDQRRITANGKGTFDKILDGIEKAVEAGLPVQIRYNVNFSEEGFKEELIDLLKERKILQQENVWFNAAPIVGNMKGKYCPDLAVGEYLKTKDFVQLPEEFKASIEKYHSLVSVFYNKPWNPRHFSCGACFNNRIIDPEGLVYACTVLVGNKEYATEYFDGEDFHYNENFHLWQERTIDKMEKCRDCWAGFICGGGCPYPMIKEGEGLKKPNCQKTQQLIEVYLPFLFKRLVWPKLKVRR